MQTDTNEYDRIRTYTNDTKYNHKYIHRYNPKSRGRCKHTMHLPLQKQIQIQAVKSPDGARPAVGAAPPE